MGFAEYGSYDALGLAELVRKGQVKAEELLDEAIARADRVNPALNAIVARRDETARREARAGLPPGPFAGVPFLLKDLGPYLAGTAMAMGSRSLRAHVPAHDSELVRRYKAAGLNIFGKTNTPEFGNSAYTEPVLFGPCRNPWDTRRTPGGSSGGSAAAVAAGIVPMAHGNDGGGSLRIPASCCGIFGLKPSRGRMPRDADMVMGPGLLSVDHVMSRSVRDSAAALDATHGAGSGLKGGPAAPAEPYLASAGRDPGKLRVALVASPMFATKLDPECADALADAAKLVESLGHTVEETQLPVDYAALRDAFILLFFGELTEAIDTAARLSGRPVGREVIESVPWFARAYFASRDAETKARADQVKDQAARAIADFMAKYDVILAHNLGSPPIPVGKLAPNPVETLVIDLASRTRWEVLMQTIIATLGKKAFAWTPTTPVFNVTGQPAMSVPLYWSKAGLPMGAHFVGRTGDETTLFRLAGQLERARPWFDRRPKIAA